MPFAYRHRAKTQRKPQIVAGFAATLACLGLLGCRTAPAGPERPLEVVVPTEAVSLDFRFTTRSLDIKITRLTHAGLVGLEPDSLRPVPLVAEKLDLKDGRTLDVTLKPGLRFHSGRNLSPNDVCATLRALGDPALKSPHRPVVAAIGSCEVVAPLRLRLRLSEARATLLTDLEVPILPAVEAREPERPDGTLDGLGPYRVSRMQPGVVELEPADTGLLPRPHHALVIRTVRDENARALRLLAGRADVAPNAVSPALLPTLERRPGLSVQSRPGANVTYLLMQNDRKPLNDARVRHAIARSIDRELIVRSMLAGRGRVASWLFPAGHWSYVTPLPSEPFDPAAAGPTLAPLREVTLLTSTDRLRQTIARALAQMLGDAGLKVRVVPLDLGVMLARLDAGDFDLATLQMPELTEPNLLDWFFHPSRVPGEGREGKNRARYRSATAGALLDEAGRDADPAKRAVIYQRLAHRMAQDLPVVPLWHEDQVAVVSERARGFQLSAEGRWGALAGLE